MSFPLQIMYKRVQKRYAQIEQQKARYKTVCNTFYRPKHLI